MDTMKKFFKILGFIGAIIAILVVIGLFINMSLTKVIKAQLSAIKAGKLEEAYYAYTSDQFQKSISLEQFKQFVQQYPALAKNKKVSFTSWKIENNQGYVKGNLTGEDGSTLPMEYHLIKENGQWKILSIKTKESGIITSGNKEVRKKGWQTFSDPSLGYRIQYPPDWIWKKDSETTIIFSGKEGTDAYYSTVTIQNLASTEMGGVYRSVDEVIKGIQNQLSQAENSTVTSPEKIDFQAEEGKTVEGKMFLAQYKMQGENFKQVVIVVPRTDGKIFYTFTYTSPVDQYDKFYENADAMFKTWEILPANANGTEEKSETSKQNSSLPVELDLIKEPEIIDDYYKTYSVTLKLTNKGSERINAQRFLTFDKGWNKDNVYFFSFCCQKPNGESSCWTTMDNGAKCSVTKGYNVAKFDFFESIPTGKEGQVAFHFCGSAFSELLLKQGKIAPTIQPPKPLTCQISLYYRKKFSEGDKLIGQTQPFSLDFGFDVR